jgi:hypothetical protein
MQVAVGSDKLLAVLQLTNRLTAALLTSTLLFHVARHFKDRHRLHKAADTDL